MSDFSKINPDINSSAESNIDISKNLSSPTTMLLIIAVSIFVAEAVIMAILFVLPEFPFFLETLFDAVTLVVLVSPVLYIFLFRPLVLYISKHALIEAELNKLKDELEKKVIDRTEHLKIAASIGEHLTSILNLEELMVDVVNQIKVNFGYYHTNIYLLDNEKAELIFAEGTGEAGQEMKAKRRTVSLTSPSSMVAHAARTSQVIWLDNVREAENWQIHPLLSDTYSKMAVPIIVRGQVVGVLEVQEDRIAAFDESDSSLLRSLANQIAVSIRNTRLFAEVETSLAEARQAQEQYIEHSWNKSNIKSNLEQLYTHSSSAPPLSEAVMIEAKQLASAHHKPAIVGLSNDEAEKKNIVVAPVLLQGKMVGTLQMHRADSSERQWTAKELEVAEIIVGQIAQSAEKLRLFDETRERAGFEEMASDITDKLQQAQTLDALAKIAGEELGKLLGASHSLVKLGKISGQANGNGGDKL